jgi:hypothetical protein
MTTDFGTSDIDPGRAALREGIDLYNRGEYFEAHEVLEGPWKQMTGAERDIYQGLIKASAAFHHASRTKWRGAILLLRRALIQLGPHATLWDELPLDGFLTRISACLEEIERCDAEGGDWSLEGVPPLPEIRA